MPRDNLVNNSITNANTNDLELIYNGDRLGDLLELLDDLHSAASENTLQQFISLGEQDVLGMLKELVYTAQETISEIEANRAQRATRKPARQSRRQVNEQNGRANGQAVQPLPANIVQFSDHFAQHIVQVEDAPAADTHQPASGTRHACSS